MSPFSVELQPSSPRFVKYDRRPQSAPGSADSDAQNRLSASNAPIFIPVGGSEVDHAGFPRRTRIAKKSRSYTASTFRVPIQPVEDATSDARRRRLPSLPIGVNSTSAQAHISSRTPLPPYSAYPSSPRPLPRLPPTPTPSMHSGHSLPTPPPRTSSLHHIRVSRSQPQLTLPDPVTFSNAHKNLPPCPTSPATPVFTLEEVQKKNWSKLRRHLGESIPPEMVVAINPRAASPCSMDTSSHCSHEDDVVHTDEMLESGRWPIETNRYSQHWVREKGGQRWFEDDYKGIIDTLRKL